MKKINWSSEAVLLEWKNALLEGSAEQIGQFMASGAPVNRILPEDDIFDEEPPLNLLAKRDVPGEETEEDFPSAAISLVLIKHGAKAQAANRPGTTALMYAAQDKPKMVGVLIEHGADVKAYNRHGHTALHYAAGGNNEASIETLVRNGADVNAADKQGNTPLHKSCEDAHFESTVKLISLGADVKAANEKGDTPLDVLIGDMEEIGQYESHTVKVLLAAKNDEGYVYPREEMERMWDDEKYKAIRSNLEEQIQLRIEEERQFLPAAEALAQIRSTQVSADWMEVEGGMGGLGRESGSADEARRQPGKLREVAAFGTPTGVGERTQFNRGGKKTSFIF